MWQSDLALYNAKEESGWPVLQRLAETKREDVFTKKEK